MGTAMQSEGKETGTLALIPNEAGEIQCVVRIDKPQIPKKNCQAKELKTRENSQIIEMNSKFSNRRIILIKIN